MRWPPHGAPVTRLRRVSFEDFKVERIALQNAASIASLLLLTTEYQFHDPFPREGTRGRRQPRRSTQAGRPEGAA
jgi:hypothetical protein